MHGLQRVANGGGSDELLTAPLTCCTAGWLRLPAWMLMIYLAAASHIIHPSLSRCVTVRTSFSQRICMQRTHINVLHVYCALQELIVVLLKSWIDSGML